MCQGTGMALAVLRNDKVIWVVTWAAEPSCQPEAAGKLMAQKKVDHALFKPWSTPFFPQPRGPIEVVSRVALLCPSGVHPVEFPVQPEEFVAGVPFSLGDEPLSPRSGPG